MADLINKRELVNATEVDGSVLTQLEHRFLKTAWNHQVKRDASGHRLFPFIADEWLHEGSFGLDFSHPFHRITARADIPSDDVTRLVGISPGVLI